MSAADRSGSLVYIHLGPPIGGYFMLQETRPDPGVRARLWLPPRTPTIISETTDPDSGNTLLIIKDTVLDETDVEISAELQGAPNDMLVAQRYALRLSEVLKALYALLALIEPAERVGEILYAKDANQETPLDLLVVNLETARVEGPGNKVTEFGSASSIRKDFIKKFGPPPPAQAVTL